MLIGGYSEEAKKYPLHGYQNVAVDFILDRLTIKDELGAGLFLDPGSRSPMVRKTKLSNRF